MRLPTLRLRVWVLMAVVLASGVAVWGHRMLDRRGRFLKEAAFYAWSESEARGDSDEIALCGTILYTMSPEERRATVERAERRQAVRRAARIDYFGALAAKYRRAADRPWLTAPPDPPVPDAVRFDLMWNLGEYARQVGPADTRFASDLQARAEAMRPPPAVGSEMIPPPDF